MASSNKSATLPSSLWSIQPNELIDIIIGHLLNDIKQCHILENIVKDAQLLIKASTTIDPRTSGPVWSNAEQQIALLEDCFRGAISILSKAQLKHQLDCVASQWPQLEAELNLSFVFLGLSIKKPANETDLLRCFTWIKFQGEIMSMSQGRSKAVNDCWTAQYAKREALKEAYLCYGHLNFHTTFRYLPKVLNRKNVRPKTWPKGAPPAYNMAHAKLDQRVGLYWAHQLRPDRYEAPPPEFLWS